MELLELPPLPVRRPGRKVDAARNAKICLALAQGESTAAVAAEWGLSIVRVQGIYSAARKAQQESITAAEYRKSDKTDTAALAAALADDRLTASDKILYAALADLAEMPTLPEMAAMIDRSIRTIQRSIERLDKHGYIKPAGNGGYNNRVQQWELTCPGQQSYQD